MSNKQTKVACEVEDLNEAHFNQIEASKNPNIPHKDYPESVRVIEIPSSSSRLNKLLPSADNSIQSNVEESKH